MITSVLLVKEGKPSYRIVPLNDSSCISCWSYLGKVGSGAQNLSLGIGCTHAVPAHEIMHALGRYHEQSRADRDRHVRIVTANISTDIYNRHYCNLIYYR